jgi:hypothetical protein
MPEIKSHTVTNKALFLGDNEFETGLLTVPAETTVPVGALLKRAGDKFAPVVDTDTTPGTPGTPSNGGGWTAEPTDPIPGDVPVAVNPVEIKNSGGSPADIPFRALVAGKVRADMLSVNGQPITEAQSDMLRAYGILPRKVTDIYRLDN